MEINILIAKNDLSIKHKTWQPHLKRKNSTILMSYIKENIIKETLFIDTIYRKINTNSCA